MRIQRQWQILISLLNRRFGLTIKELAAEVGVDTRTIRRDLSTLSGAGFALEERISDHGRKHWGKLNDTNTFELRKCSFQGISGRGNRSMVEIGLCKIARI